VVAVLTVPAVSFLIAAVPGEHEWHRGFLITGVVFGALAVAAVAWAIVGTMRGDKEEESKPPLGPAGISMEESEDISITDTHVEDAPAGFLGRRNKNLRFDRFTAKNIRSSPVAPVDAEHDPMQKDTRRKSWLFPEAPWKRKKPSDE
jgi:hypothetical protein